MLYDRYMETTLIRIRKDDRDKLKKMAQDDGRTVIGLIHILVKGEAAESNTSPVEEKKEKKSTYAKKEVTLGDERKEAAAKLQMELKDKTIIDSDAYSLWRSTSIASGKIRPGIPDEEAISIYKEENES